MTPGMIMSLDARAWWANELDGQESQNALKRLGFRPRNFLAQLLSETSVA
jgi:hypothetical protein